MDYFHVDPISIGRTIQMLRKWKGLTQKELSQGICRQSEISKIESGQYIPLASTLYFISKRLGVDVSYFFEAGEPFRYDYVKEVCQIIREKTKEKKYEEVEEVIHIERNNPLFQSKDLQQFFLWHEGICIYYLRKDREEALKLLHKALNFNQEISHSLTEREIAILNSIGVIYTDEGDYHKAKGYFTKGIDEYNKIKLSKNPEIILRLYYNIAKTLTRLGEYRNSLQYCTKGITLSVSNDSLYLLGQLIYQKGLNLEHLNKKVEALEYMKRSKIIFEMKQFDDYVTFIDDRIKEIEEELVDAQNQIEAPC